MTVEKRVAIVTGASRGIGLAITRVLAAEGVQVLMTSRKQAQLDASAARVDGAVTTFAANAGDPDQAAACVQHCIEMYGRVDMLVNNAATAPYWGRMIDEPASTHDKTWQVNLRGPLMWSQLVWRASMLSHGGSILNISSLGATTTEPNAGSYNVTKAALEHMTRHLAMELAPKVRVNAIAPGLVRTDMARALVEGREHEFAASIPLARLGEPEDVARLAAFLLSDASSWMTGQTVVLDGGISVTTPRALLM